MSTLEPRNFIFKSWHYGRAVKAKDLNFMLSHLLGFSLAGLNLLVSINCLLLYFFFTFSLFWC